MPWKLLIAAGDSATERSQIPAGVMALIEAAEEILIVAPTLPSRLDWLSGEIDKKREIADERLRAVLGHLAETGEEAEGTVGSDDPMVALGDAIADFGPDHIVIALRGQDESGWQERGLVGDVLERFGLPVTAFELGVAASGS